MKLLNYYYLLIFINNKNNINMANNNQFYTLETYIDKVLSNNNENDINNRELYDLSEFLTLEFDCHDFITVSNNNRIIDNWDELLNLIDTDDFKENYHIKLNLEEYATFIYNTILSLNLSDERKEFILDAFSYYNTFEDFIFESDLRFYYQDLDYFFHFQ